MAAGSPTPCRWRTPKGPCVLPMNHGFAHSAWPIRESDESDDDPDDIPEDGGIAPPKFLAGDEFANAALSFGPVAEVRATRDHAGLTVVIFDAEGGEVLSATVRFGPHLDAVVEHLSIEQERPSGGPRG